MIFMPFLVFLLHIIKCDWHRVVTYDDLDEYSTLHKQSPKTIKPITKVCPIFVLQFDKIKA